MNNYKMVKTKRNPHICKCLDGETGKVVQGLFYLNFTFKKVKTRKLCHGNFENAENEYHEIKRKIQNEVNAIPKTTIKGNGNTLFRDLVEEWLQCHVAGLEPNTRRRLETQSQTLIDFFGNMHISEISREDAEHWQKARKEHVSYSTVNVELSAFKNIIKSAIDRKIPLIENSDALRCKRLKVKKKVGRGKHKLFTKMEQRIMLENFNPYMRNFIHLQLSTGLRQSEVQNLTWDEVHIQEPGKEYLHVVGSKSYDRIVELSPTIVKLLKSLSRKKVICRNKDNKNLFGKEVEYVITQDNGYPHTMTNRILTNEQEFFNKQSKDFKLDTSKTTHCARHSFATELLENGFDIATISELLGHSSVTETSRTYLHATEDSRRKAINSRTGDNAPGSTKLNLASAPERETKDSEIARLEQQLRALKGAI